LLLSGKKGLSLNVHATFCARGDPASQAVAPRPDAAAVGPSSYNMAGLVLAVVLQLSLAEAVSISNVIPRTDTDGDIISAGDGCVSYHPDEQRYYLFGAHYQPCEEPNDDCYSGSVGEGVCSKPGFVPSGECCGWRNATIASWSSPDLVTWRKEGLNILPLATANPASPLSSNYGAIFEPCGVFNRKTGFWTLFFLRDGYTLASAVARSAAGPFSVVQWSVDVPGFNTIVDFYFWQSLDGTLIMKHNGGGGETAVVLSDDYMRVVNSSALFGTELGYTEGGGIFTYGGATYVMAGYGCCFCTLGSNGFLWRANSTLGTYELLGDFVPRNDDGSSVTHSQHFSVTPVYTDAGVVPMFIGIRFGSAPDYEKDHDYQFWLPLTFDPATGRMHNVSWVDEFVLNLTAPAPPPPPPFPPSPWFSCSFDNVGDCVEVPAGAPGAVASNGACEAACVPEYVCSAGVPGGAEQCVPVPPGIIAGAAPSCDAACAPVYGCSALPGSCEPMPHGTPGAVPSLAECEAQCVLCNIAGTWVGQSRSVDITIAEAPINATANTVTISVPPGVWSSNATGIARPGWLRVSGGWCDEGGGCVGIVSPLEAGGPQCAMITWDAGVWCSPAVEPSKCPSSRAASGSAVTVRRGGITGP